MVQVVLQELQGQAVHQELVVQVEQVVLLELVVAQV